jgi:NADH-quinone oxidoreductase subunit N
MIFASDFLTLFIGVEVASLALYCLCGARVTKEASSEAALKYFLLGCVSSAFMLFGIALWYGVTGGLAIAPINSAGPLVILSFVMMLVGLAFKIGLAPFHLWVPDVYQGAPTSVTTYMSCVVKVAAFAALFKIALNAFLLPSEWAVGVLWFLSVLAMTVGNLAALQQRSVKRMLAYSSVAQAGYMMIGLVVLGDTSSVLASSVFYLAGYCAMTIGAFTVLSVIGPDADSVDDLKGLVKRSPFLALSMTLFFLALAGLPPSMAGLMGKVYLFTGALSSKFYGLAIIAVLNSALACAYYFRVPAAMLFQAPPTTEPVKVSVFSTFALTFCVATVVGIGLYPEPLVEVCEAVAAVVVR